MIFVRRTFCILLVITAGFAIYGAPADTVRCAEHSIEIKIIDLCTTDGRSTDTFLPGESLIVNAQLSANGFGMHRISCLLRGNSWSTDAEHTLLLTGGSKAGAASWNVTIPSYALGAAQAVVSADSLIKSITATADFRVAARQKHFTGPFFCGLCHRDNYFSWIHHGHYPFPDCEACHGPGAQHALTLNPYTMHTETDAVLCGQCHSSDNTTDVRVSDELIEPHQEYTQWYHSPHNRKTQCITCHRPHSSTINSSSSSRTPRQVCTNCHAGKTVRGSMHDLDCVDCHMPPMVKKHSASGTSPYRFGDAPSHIWRIKVSADPQDLLVNNGTRLNTDSKGYFLTLDAACLYCHNGKSAVKLDVNDVKRAWRLIH